MRRRNGTCSEVRPIVTPQPPLLAQNIDRLLSGRYATATAASRAFGIMAEAFARQPITGRAEGTFLSWLATLPGITYDGTTTARSGVSGVGFTVPAGSLNGHFSYELVFNPADGQLLELDTIADRGLPAQNIAANAVVRYLVILGGGSAAESAVPPISTEP